MVWLVPKADKISIKSRVGARHLVQLHFRQEDSQNCVCGCFTERPNSHSNAYVNVWDMTGECGIQEGYSILTKSKRIRAVMQLARAISNKIEFCC